jgi:cell division protein FtsZ
LYEQEESRLNTAQIFKLTRKTGMGALPCVCVAGVGTAGVHVVDRIGASATAGLRVAALHTNRSVLAASQVQTRIPLGGEVVAGGCGGVAESGRKAAEHDVEMVRGLISDCQALILVAGLGGGTASGALPVLLQAAKGAGVFTAVVLTTPYGFEGADRQRRAEDALRAIVPIADFTTVTTNDALMAGQEQVAIEHAFEKALDTLAAGVCSVWQMLGVPSLLSIDQGDLRAVGADAGTACQFAFGMGTGEKRAESAIQSLLANRATSASLSGGNGVVACVCASRDLSLAEVQSVLDPLQKMVPDSCVFRAGVVLHDSWRDRLFLSVFIGDSRRKVSATVRSTGTSAPQKAKSAAASRSQQEELNLDGITPATGQGRFGRTKATILDGEDLDIPTYVRRNIKLGK